MTVLNELEKSVREVLKKRLVHDRDELWQQIFHKYVITNLKDFIYFHKNYLTGFANSIVEDDLSEDDEEQREILNHTNISEI